MALVLYRIIKAREPTLLDFTSLAAQGLAPGTDDPELQRLHMGISCWATESQARRTARRFPTLGTHIATLVLPEDAPVRVARTRGPGHHTAWGAPEDLQASVSSVAPV